MTYKVEQRETRVAPGQISLLGRIERGMFPSEVAFIVTDHLGNARVVFVPKELIQDEHGNPSIRVRLLDRQDDIALVRMPGEALDSSVVSVRTSELVPA